MVRVHIDKIVFISRGFWCTDNFGSKELGTSSIRSLIGPYELGPNHQPISDEINHGPSSYKPKLSLHQNPRDINTILSIWTRTIFEFIYALTFIMWLISYGVYYMIYTLWISSQKFRVVCDIFIIIICGMCFCNKF